MLNPDEIDYYRDPWWIVDTSSWNVNRWIAVVPFKYNGGKARAVEYMDFRPDDSEENKQKFLEVVERIKSNIPAAIERGELIEVEL